MIATIEVNSRSVRASGPTTELTAEESVAAEQHYAPREIGEMWKLSEEKVRQIFQDEPGVVVLQAPVKKGKRSYRTLRIPHSVLTRVHMRFQR